MRLLIWDGDQACPWESDKNLAEALCDYFDQFVSADQVVKVSRRVGGEYWDGDATAWEVLSEVMWARRKLWNRWCGDHQKVDEYEEGKDYCRLVHYAVEVYDQSTDC